MPAPNGNIPEDVLKAAVENSGAASTSPKNGTAGAQGAQPGGLKPGEHRQRTPFKKKRAGVVLSREQVREIKEKRRELRRDMKSRGIRSKKEFELVAGSMGYYFDKNRGCLLWILRHWFGFLLALLALLILILFIFSVVTQLRGHFTINLSSGMFRDGFVLSETVDFKRPTTELFANPAENVPCISIKSIPDDVDESDGEHNGEYFAYTYYIRNEGDHTVDYEWAVELNSESQNLSNAVWAMIFEDGAMRFYAENHGNTSEPEILPPREENDKGYLNIPVMKLSPDGGQFELVRKTIGGAEYYRIIPDKFESSTIIARGKQTAVAPRDVHKYTVVLWLEGDDPDTDDSKIGGHLGVEMDFRLIDESPHEDGERSEWQKFWDSLKFW